MNKEMYRKIVKIIKKYDNIVLARHISPDPDAIASQIALRDAIKLTFPNKNVYAVGAGVNKFRYLGVLDKPNYKELDKPLLVVLDVPNFCRVDGINGLEYHAILKIDHHPGEDIMGDVDWTDTTKSSTCEMITMLLLNTSLKMDTKIAENLYIGMVFDSDRFLLQNTTKETLKTAYDLLNKSNINITPLYNNLYERSIKEERFKAYLINNIEITENKFGYIFVPSEDLKKFEVESTSVSNQVNNFYFINEIICWMFVVYDERNNIYKANIRSRGPIINEVAAKFNGGGHEYASGCRSTDYKVIEELAHALDETCKEYNDNENI